MRRRVYLLSAVALGQIAPSAEVRAQIGETLDSMAVVRAIEARLEAEVKSFEAKDCGAALSFYSDVMPLFVVGGRAMPRRENLAAGCPGMVQRLPPGARRAVASQVVHALGATAGYSVTEFLIPAASGPLGPTRSQFVTKIWQLRVSEWLIVHVHESVGPPTN